MKGQKIVASNFILCSATVLSPFCHAQSLARSHGMLPGCFPPVFFVLFSFFFFPEDAGYGSECQFVLDHPGMVQPVSPGWWHVSLFP